MGATAGTAGAAGAVSETTSSDMRRAAVREAVLDWAVKAPAVAKVADSIASFMFGVVVAGGDSLWIPQKEKL